LATTFGSRLANITTSTVVLNRPGVVHGILINSCAATTTIDLFDDITTTSPANRICGTWTPGAIVIPTFVTLGLATNNGFVILIAVAACNLTVIGR
jgi:hypothetical protein